MYGFRKAGALAPAALAIAFALITASSASAGNAKGQHKTVKVEIQNMKFVPETVEVAPGDTVIWTNDDLFPHTVTAEHKRFNSGSIAAGASWKFVAKKKGTFPYICTFHPVMKGKLIVK